MSLLIYKHIEIVCIKLVRKLNFVYILFSIFYPVYYYNSIFLAKVISTYNNSMLYRVNACKFIFTLKAFYGKCETLKSVKLGCDICSLNS